MAADEQRDHAAEAALAAILGSIVLVSRRRTATLGTIAVILSRAQAARTARLEVRFDDLLAAHDARESVAAQVGALDARIGNLIRNAADGLHRAVNDAKRRDNSLSERIVELGRALAARIDDLEESAGFVPPRRDDDGRDRSLRALDRIIERRAERAALEAPLEADSETDSETDA